MQLTPKIVGQADCVIVLTLDEARQLPNLLGRIVPAMLQEHGFYTADVDGIATVYVLPTTKVVRMPPYEVRKRLREATLKVGRDDS